MAEGGAAHGLLDLQHTLDSLPVWLPSEAIAVVVQGLCCRADGCHSRRVPGLSTVRAQPEVAAGKTGSCSDPTAPSFNAQLQAHVRQDHGWQM